jgi:hypothetical protein
MGQLELEARIGGYEAAAEARGKRAQTYSAVSDLLNCSPEEVAGVSCGVHWMRKRRSGKNLSLKGMVSGHRLHSAGAAKTQTVTQRLTRPFDRPSRKPSSLYLRPTDGAW